MGRGTEEPDQIRAEKAGLQSDDTVKPMGRGNDPVAELAVLIKAALPLATELVEEYDPGSRVELRDLVGQEKIFELANALNALSGEQARSQSQWGTES